MFILFAPQSYLPIIEPAISKNLHRVHGIALRHSITAYGIKLPSETDTSADYGYGFLHSIADIVARFVDIKGGQVCWNTLEGNSDLPLKIRGVAGLRDRIVRILNCNRALDEGDLVDGFGFGLGVDYSHDLAGQVVALRLREAYPKLAYSPPRCVGRKVPQPVLDSFSS